MAIFMTGESWFAKSVGLETPEAVREGVLVRVSSTGDAPVF